MLSAMAYVTARQPEPTSSTALRKALEADLNRLEQQYLEAGEARPLRVCLAVYYGSKFMVFPHGPVHVEPNGAYSLKVTVKPE